MSSKVLVPVDASMLVAPVHAVADKRCLNKQKKTPELSKKETNSMQSRVLYEQNTVRKNVESNSCANQRLAKFDPFSSIY